MKTAFIYPGQGAQAAGMGADFYQNSILAKETFDQASEILGYDTPSLCFTPNDLLDRTDYTQIALYVTCVAITRELKARGIKPDLTAGLSLGEYPAIQAAGGASFQDLLETVALRGKLMHQAAPGDEYGMSAVLGLTGDQVKDVTDRIRGVSVANYNCPGQIVLTGLKQAIDQASADLKKMGARRILPLNVSGPFHSPYMEEAGEALADQLGDVNWKPLLCPYVANVNARLITDIGETPKLLKEQVSAPVCWEQSVRAMIEAGVECFYEIGPGKTLAKFIARIDKGVRVKNIASYEDLRLLMEEMETC